MRFLTPWLRLLLLVLLLPLPGCESTPPRPNIILVVLDTVRRDLTGMGADGQRFSSVTPQLDEIAATGTAFTNAYSTAPWTVPAHGSIFTGYLPSAHGATFARLRLVPEMATVSSQLTAAGYRTAAFFSNTSVMQRNFETAI